LRAVGLRSVQVTLDGPAPVHDRVRTTRNGGPTFTRILANLAAAAEATDIRFTIRVNLTRAALDDLGGLVARLAATVDAARCRLHIAPVLDYGQGSGDLVTPSDDTARRVLDGYALAQDAGFSLARPRAPYCPFCSDRDGRYGAVVNADGALYSCWESVGRAGYEVGTVWDGYARYPADRWVSCGHFARPAAAAHRTAAFLDAVDAGVLDLIRSRRLSRRAAAHPGGQYIPQLT
jgi:uncharacterized protein